jgi:hypothetical protein
MKDLEVEVIAQAIRACSFGCPDGTAVCIPEDAAHAILEHIARAGGRVLLPEAADG